MKIDMGKDFFEPIDKYFRGKGQISQKEYASEQEELRQKKVKFLYGVLNDFNKITSSYLLTNKDLFFKEIFLKLDKSIEKSIAIYRNVFMPEFDISLKKQFEIFDELLSIDYKAPTDPETLFLHLQSLILYYLEFDARISNLLISQKFDFAMTKVVDAVMFSNAAIYLKKGPDLDRTRSPHKPKEKRKQRALELAYKIENREDKSKSNIASIIKGRWPKDQKSPCLNTIKNYLEDEWERLNIKR